MLAIELLKRSDQFGHEGCWQLCFDEHAGIFSVLHGNSNKDVEDVGMVAKNERSSSQLFKAETAGLFQALDFNFETMQRIKMKRATSAMLVLPMQRNDIDGNYSEEWDLCFDSERGRFFVKHTTHDQERQTSPTVEYVPTVLCQDMISEKVKELGFTFVENEVLEVDRTCVAEI